MYLENLIDLKIRDFDKYNVEQKVCEQKNENEEFKQNFQNFYVNYGLRTLLDHLFVSL